THGNRSIEIGQELMSVRTRRRLRPMGTATRKHRAQPQCPTPPAPPKQSGEKTSQRRGRRSWCEWDLRTEQKILMPRNDGAATQAEANFFVAEAHDSQITKASDRTPVNRPSQRLRGVGDDANVFPGGKF